MPTLIDFDRLTAIILQHGTPKSMILYSDMHIIAYEHVADGLALLILKADAFIYNFLSREDWIQKLREEYTEQRERMIASGNAILVAALNAKLMAIDVLENDMDADPSGMFTQNGHAAWPGTSDGSSGGHQ